MRNLLIAVIFMFAAINLFAQDNDVKEQRYIEVTGSAELEVEADEIIFAITYSEYWLEEFQLGTKYEDYRTKYPMEKIEEQLLSTLYEIESLNKQLVDSNKDTSKSLKNVEKSAKDSAKGIKKVGSSIKNIAKATGIIFLLQV